MFKGANVLIAGGAGFVGANLIRRMLDLGANVRATLHRKDAVIIDPRIEYVKADLLKQEDCHRVNRDMDVVFLCAANTSGAAVIASTPLVHVTPNIIMNAQMLEAAYFAKAKKFIFLSSNAAYPPSADQRVREEEMFDGEPYDIYYGVAWMKRYTEILCRLYAEKLKDPMQTVVVRPSNIYGPYDDFDFATSHMMSATIRKVVERQAPIKVWGTGDDIRDLIYIDDFIDGLVLAAEKIEAFEPVNLAYGKGYSIKDILNICLEEDGYQNAAVEYDKTKPSMIPVRLIDIHKAERMLGFKAHTSIRDGIRLTMAWYREHFLPARKL
jgi:GDP-L-fucose synthase